MSTTFQHFGVKVNFLWIDDLEMPPMSFNLVNRWKIFTAFFWNLDLLPITSLMLLQSNKWRDHIQTMNNCQQWLAKIPTNQNQLHFLWSNLQVAVFHCWITSPITYSKGLVQLATFCSHPFCFYFLNPSLPLSTCISFSLQITNSSAGK